MPLSFTPEHHRATGYAGKGWEPIPGPVHDVRAVRAEQERILAEGGMIYQVAGVTAYDDVGMHPANEAGFYFLGLITFSVLFLSSVNGPLYALLFLSTCVGLYEIWHLLRYKKFGEGDPDPGKIVATIGTNLLVLYFLHQVGW